MAVSVPVRRQSVLTEGRFGNGYEAECERKREGSRRSNPRWL
jgi:hypothetical protein